MSRSTLLHSVVFRDPAGALLDTVIATRIGSHGRASVNLATYADATRLDLVFDTVRDPADHESYILVYRDTREEAVLELQGFIVAANLPPIGPTYRYRPGSCLSVELSAPAGTAFKNSLLGLTKLSEFIVAKVQAQTFVKTRSEVFEGQPSVRLTQRFLTPAGGPLGKQPLPDDVDPHGVLAAQAPEFVFTDGNRVEYSERVVQANGSSEYIRLSPASFQLCQLVEAQICIRLRLVPRQKGASCVVHQLVGLTMLDRMDADITNAKNQSRAGGGGTVLRRRRMVYENELARQEQTAGGQGDDA